MENVRQRSFISSDLAGCVGKLGLSVYLAVTGGLIIGGEGNLSKKVDDYIIPKVAGFLSDKISKSYGDGIKVRFGDDIYRPYEIMDEE